MPRIRLNADERRAQLLDAGYKIAKKDGILAVTRASVARACNCTDGLLNRYFDSREGLRTAVIQYAADQKDAATLADASVVYELDGFDIPRNLMREVNAAVAVL